MRAPPNSACNIAAWLACAVLPFVATAFAKDLEMLTRLLTPAYMVHNFSALCMDQDAQFLSDLNGGTALIDAFSEHVKQEVILDLPEAEAKTVLVWAADSALHVARLELQMLKEQTSAVPSAALKRWCDRSAKFFIVEIMSKHQEKHDEFEKAVKAAKR